MRITEEQKRQGQELHKALIEKAWKSDSFKDQLIDNPHDTINTITGGSISRDVNIIIEDQTDEEFIFLNIPRKVNVDNIELTDEQLETVSGGEIVLGVVVGVEIAIILVGVGYTFAAANDN